MNLSILSKSLVTTVVVTIAAYFVAPAPDALSPALLMASGAAIGGLLASFVAALNSSSAPKRTPARTTQKQNTSSGDATTLFVGNLAYKASASDLRALFEEYGTVHSARIVTDRATRRPRGYGFVEIDSQSADAAIQALNDFDFSGRTLNVNVARPRAEANS